MLTFFEALVGLLVLQSLGIAAEIAQGLGEVKMRGSVVGIETNRLFELWDRSIELAPVRPAYVREVAAGGAAELAGIRLGDQILTVDGRDVNLTPSEFRLLLLFAEDPERAFTRHQIMEHLWQTPYVGDTRACDAHVSNLRRKIERDPTHPERIVTVREVGYKLVPA